MNKNSTIEESRNKLVDALNRLEIFLGGRNRFANYLKIKLYKQVGVGRFVIKHTSQNGILLNMVIEELVKEIDEVVKISQVSKTPWGIHNRDMLRSIKYSLKKPAFDPQLVEDKFSEKVTSLFSKTKPKRDK